MSIHSKLSSAALAGLMAGALSACGGSQPAATPAPTPAAAPAPAAAPKQAAATQTDANAADQGGAMPEHACKGMN